MSQLYNTFTQNPNDQFDYWREELCHVFVELAPERATKGIFKGSICQQSLSDIMVSRVTADAHCVKRTPYEIGRSSDELYFANLQVEGTG